MSIKLLILADIHSQIITLEEVLETTNNMAKKPNSCIIAGDITNFGSIENLENILCLITRYYKNTYYVLGNCDPKVELGRMKNQAINLEGRTFDIGGVVLVGFGGQHPNISKKTRKKLNKQNKKICLVTHVPPYNTKADIDSWNRHVGSRLIRDLIDLNPNIFLSISGHIHDSSTISTINSCKIINPGPLTRGNFAILDIKDNFKISAKLYNIHEVKNEK